MISIGEFNIPNQHSSQTPSLCDLTALNVEQRERHWEVMEQLR